MKRFHRSFVAFAIMLAASAFGPGASIIDPYRFAVVPSGPTLIANTGANLGASGGTTSSINTTGANFIVVCVTYYSTPTLSLSDSNGNTWSARTAYQASGQPGIVFYYCYAPTVGSGHTFTIGGAIQYSSLTVSAWSGMASSPYDVENGTNYGSSTTAYQTGSVTPSQANTLIIAGCCFDLGAPVVVANISINSGFTITDTVPYSYGVGEGNSMAYKVMTSASATNPTFTSDISAPGAANIAVFKY